MKVMTAKEAREISENSLMEGDKYSATLETINDSILERCFDGSGEKYIRVYWPNDVWDKKLISYLETLGYKVTGCRIYNLLGIDWE